MGAGTAASPADRRAILLRAAQLVKERTSDVIATMTPETGATFGWGMFMVTLAEGMFLEAAAAATAPVGEVLATNDAGALSRRSAGRSALSQLSRRGTRRLISAHGQ